LIYLFNFGAWRRRKVKVLATAPMGGECPVPTGQRHFSPEFPVCVRNRNDSCGGISVVACGTFKN